MNNYPFLSTPELLGAYRERVKLLLQDRANLLPEWARQEAADLLRRKKLIVCGSTCNSEIRVLAKNAEVLAIVDDYRVGQKVFGIPVISSDSWIGHMRGDKNIVACILVSTGNAYRYFMRQCVQWELPYLDPLQIIHLFKTHKINTQNEAGRFFWYGYEFFVNALESSDKFIKLSEHLEDDFSRFTWFSILMYRLTLNPLYLELCGVGYGAGHDLNSYTTNGQFLKFSDQEVYIDAGAFTGDTIERFLLSVNGKFKHIYSFEPSPASNREIRQRLFRLQDRYLDDISGKITLIEKGLWDSEKILRFNPNNVVKSFAEGVSYETQSAHIIDTGIVSHMVDISAEKNASIEVPVTTIDKATNQDATFIKFEIEGSELEALHGGVKTIERNRPKMALSIYHKPEDFDALTNFVLNLKLDYKLGFRQHNPICPDATVLYCHH